LLKTKIPVTEAAVAGEPVEAGQPGASRKKIFLWAGKGGLAVLDQGLISGSNFVISVLLARWLVPEQYGAYAVALGINVLLFTVYQSLLLEPMSVFGGSSYRECLRGYLGSLFWIHAAASVCIFVAFGASALVAKLLAPASVLPGALLGVTIASPFILFFGLARRSVYLQFSPLRSTIGSFVYSLSLLAALYGLFRGGLLSPMTAFLLMGLASAATSFYLWTHLRRTLSSHSIVPPGVRESWGRHWRYGRWALAGSFVGWIPAYIYYPLLSSFGGMAHSGQLRALMNLTLPIEQMKGALGLLLIPYAARVQHMKGRSSAQKLSIKLTLLVLGGAVAYWAAILPLQGPLFHLLYSGRYSEVVHLLPVVAIGSVVWTAAYGPAIVLRGMNSPQSYFLAWALATGVSLIVGIPATWRYGLTGAIWGSNTADIFSFIFIFIILRRKIARYPENTAPSISWRGAVASTLPGESVAE
jgi:O-antigen/teichoic acid export membrane protein